MHILFIAQYYPDKLLTEFIKQTKVGLDFAAHNLHKALFQGFLENQRMLDILNAPHLGSFPPYYKTPFISSYESDDRHEISLSYLNISYVKRWDIRRKLKKRITQWCKEHHGNKVVFYYNTPGLSLVPQLKKNFPDLKACLLVTDLPEYMVANHSMLTRVNSLVSKLFGGEKKHYGKADGYILLAPAMRERLPIGNKPWIHIEGIFNPEGMEAEYPKKTKAQKVILYMGNISHRYGIINLLDAFALIKSPDYRLWIRGDGNTLEEIRRRMANDPRIVYFDKMSKQELVALQRRATILINPVFSGEEFTRYFFPSKTMEYLASGTPTVMAHLACMPKEYDPYIYYFDEESVEGIRDKIVEVCEKSQEELDVFGAKAAKFIMREKTPKPQVARVIDFLKGL